MHRTRRTLALFAAALLVAACGDDEASDRPTTAASTTTTPPITAAPTTATATTATATTVATTTASPTTASPTSSPATTTAATTSPELPLSGPVAEGTYLVPRFSPPLRLTTRGAWDALLIDAKGVALTRGANLESGFFVFADPRGQHTVERALASICVGGTLELSAPEPVEFLGRDATRQVGTAADTCLLTETYGALAGDRVIAIATDVDGTIVMVIGTGPDASWSTLEPDLEAMITSAELAT